MSSAERRLGLLAVALIVLAAGICGALEQPIDTEEACHAHR